jgi:hypothetical protein
MADLISSEEKPNKIILYSGFKNLFKNCITESQKPQVYAQKPQLKIKKTVQEFHFRITPKVNGGNDQFETTDNAI